LNFIGSKELLEIQNDPRKLIRGNRRPMFFPWRPTSPANTGDVLFVSTASDLGCWFRKDRELWEQLQAPVRLVRPGTMTQQQLLALPPTVACYWFDIWCGDEAVRHQLLEVLMTSLNPINDFVM
jgi:hypothetical protein